MFYFYKNSLFLYLFIFLLNRSLSDILILQPSSKVYKEHYEDESLDFLVVGDWGDLGLKGDKNGELQRLVANAMEKYADKYNSKFIINVGDNFYEGGVYDYQGVKSVEDEKWKTIWLEVYKGKLSTIPWYSVAGNHDWYNNITAQIDYSLNKNPRFFLPSLYYVRTSVIGPTRTKIAWIHIDTDLFFYDYNKLDQSKKVMKENFLMMGWNLESAVEEKIKWIEQKLIENQDAKWILVVGHHPLIGSCIDNHYMYRLQPLFEKHRVTAYFAGHNHVLEYKGPQDFSPMAHFISGSGSRLSEGCKGKDWGIVKPGFLHVTISDKTGEMDFQFVDASEAKDTDGKQNIHDNVIRDYLILGCSKFLRVILYVGNMLRSKGFIKRTKKGNAVKVVQEHYLRDDIWCSAEFCSKCLHTQPALTVAPSASQLFKSHFIIADTNVFMNQIDIIEHPAIQNVIVLQTVCEELRHLSLSIYNRLKNIISDKDRHFYVFSNEHHRETYTERLKDETPNDRNDRAIRMAVKWYSTHLAVLNNNREPVKIVLLSDDLGNREKATKDDLIAVSVRQYVESMVDSPELADMLSNLSTSQETKDKDFTHDEHLSSAQIANGIKSGTFYQGSLSISTHNYLEGSIMANVEGVETQIMIIGRPSMNRAIQGDVVAVQLLPKSEWLRTPTAAVVDEDEESNLSMDTEEDQDSKKQSISEPEEVITLPPQPTGKVVGIIKRKWRPYCGFIKKQSVQGSISSKMSENVLVVTMDRRIPFIRIRTRQAQNIMGQRILVAIDSWPKDSRFPQGHFVRALGAAGDKATETEVLLLEHDVPHQDFSLQVLNDLPFEGANWKMTEDDIRNRADFRNLNICSIDPPGCTDIDDALHVRLLPNGNFEVGVHIADVTHFLKPGTAIDQEAANRGTTVYLVNKRVDMIPFLLGSNLCSLKENVDRLAFSCLWEINPEAEIISVNFTKSVIASKASLTYEEAQRRIDDRRLQDDLTNGIRVLNQLAKKLHAKRLERGALTLASPEVRFQLENDSQDPVDVELKELKETNALVEEFMLLANISVAEKIFSKFPSSSLLRRHPPPANANLENLSKAIAPFGFTLKFDTSKSLADSLNQAELPHEPYFNKLLRIMTTRCMMQAIYFCAGNTVQSNFRHYGLASDIYTHFTSPIRRYADVIVHRLLAACIEPNSVYGSELTDIHKMQSLCEGLNYRHRMAQMAARSSVELHTNIFFKDKIEQEEGFVTRILKNGFIVLVPRYGIEGIVYSSPTKTALAASAPPVVYNPRNNSLDSSTNNVSIKLFDKIIVQITIDEDLVGSAAGGMRQKLKMELLSPQIPGLSLDTIQGKSSARKSNDEAKLAANVKRMKVSV